MARLIALLWVAALFGACGAPPSPSSGAPSDPTSTCPGTGFDDTAILGAEFQQRSFEHDESKAITTQFVDLLSTFYARPSVVDLCQLFTADGLRTALIADRRLRSVERGDTLVDGRLVLRGAFEEDYDLRKRPPLLPIDAVFDLEAGAKVTDRRSGTIEETRAPERIGLHFDFTFDGHQWRAANVGEISADYAEWATPLAPVEPGPRCSSFKRDPRDAPFDVHADRQWCDGDGRGRVIEQRAQLTMITRFPCDKGHTAILTLGIPLGARIDPLVRYEYVRDPAGEFLSQGWLTQPFDGTATVPVDAAYTGWTNGNIDLWISPSELERAVYLVRGKVVERWSRATDEWGITDCN